MLHRKRQKFPLHFNINSKYWEKSLHTWQVPSNHKYWTRMTEKQLLRRVCKVNQALLGHTVFKPFTFYLDTCLKKQKLHHCPSAVLTTWWSSSYHASRMHFAHTAPQCPRFVFIGIFLHGRPNPVVRWIQVQTVSWPECGWNEGWVLFDSNLFYSSSVKTQKPVWTSYVMLM